MSTVLTGEPEPHWLTTSQSKAPSAVATSNTVTQWSSSTVRIAGRELRPTIAFDTYWRFAITRQAVYLARLAGKQGPWTDDSILLRHRFTNCYRAADRVSQYLIRQVTYSGSQKPEEVVFRTLLFKMFNRISTWELLRGKLGELSWSDFDYRAYDEVLGREFAAGGKLYSAAYVVPPPRLGADRKHSNHLRLLELMMTSDIGDQIAERGSLEGAFQILNGFPAMGNFLSYQFAIDLNYSQVFDFDEMEYVMPGPGARDGIRKCFGPASDGIESEIVHYVTEHQKEHFDRLGLNFPGLFGRSLQLVDCQNLFCEVDKYSRIAHPEIVGHTGRSRIKQLFEPTAQPIDAWFPPKWGLPGATQKKEAV